MFLKLHRAADNQIFNATYYYTRRTMPKRVTSLRSPSQRHSVKAT